MKPLWWYKYKKLIYLGEIQKAKDLLLKKIPEGTVIYKYCRGINRDWKMAIKPELWLCQAGKFNDPFDCAFLYNCRSKEIYDRKTEYELAVKESMAQFEQDKKSKSLQESVFISFLSEKCDSMLMWSHYSDEHKGLCLGFDLKSLIQKYDFFPVIYSNRMPKVKNADIDNKSALLKSILTKSKEWSYEQEWRIIEINKDIAGTAGKKIPFEKPIEIYMGKRQEDGIRVNNEKRRAIRKRNPSAKEVDISQSDDFYVDINWIIYYVKQEKIKLFDFELSRKDFRLSRCTYRV